MSPSTPQVIPLWPDLPPTDVAEVEIILPNGIPVVRNVTRPTLTVYLPDPALATGTALIVAPGGAYHFHAYVHEGTEVAKWLNAHGIAAFMLKYRLLPTGDDFLQKMEATLNDREKLAAYFPLQAADGCQAVRIVRERAAEWGIDPHKIGVSGFSAGGNLTLSVALHYDAASRPDFAAPIYPAPPPDAPIPADAPPLFLLCAADDDMASAVCVDYYNRWRGAGRPVELHIYSKGGHGFGMNPQGMPSDSWIERLADWMVAYGFLGKR